MPDGPTRDHLIDIGLNHMQQASYCATGLGEVLALAGVSKGSFYHHFSSKEDFGNAVLQRYVQREAERISMLLRASRTSPVKRLRRYFEELIGIYGPEGAMNGGCLLGNISQEMANHSGLIQQTLKEGFRSWEVALATTLEEAISRGELDPKANTMEMASFILNSYEGALLRAKAERSEAPLHLFLRVVFETYLTPG